MKPTNTIQHQITPKTVTKNSHNNQGSKKRKGARNNNNNKSEILTWKASEDFATRKRGMHKQTDNSFRNGFAHESRKVFGLVLEIRKEERREERERRDKG